MKLFALVESLPSHRASIAKDDLCFIVLQPSVVEGEIMVALARATEATSDANATAEMRWYTRNQWVSAPSARRWSWGPTPFFTEMSITKNSNEKLADILPRLNQS